MTDEKLEEVTKLENDKANKFSKQTSSHQTDDNEVQELVESFGKCKWFNADKGFGFITLLQNKEDEKEEQDIDVFVYQSVIKMNGFRSLREGEHVKLWFRKSSQGWEATNVCGPDGADCVGCERKHKRRKRPDRCYNCDEVGHHAKECKFPPLPKRCHHCKSVDHLVLDCPGKKDQQLSESKEANDTNKDV